MGASEDRFNRQLERIERTESQRRAALRVANERRIGGVKLREELHAGEIDLEHALDDPRAETMPVYKLLRAQFGWAGMRTGRVLVKARMNYAREVGQIPALRKRELIEFARRSPRGGDGRRADDAE